MDPPQFQKPQSRSGSPKTGKPNTHTGSTRYTLNQRPEGWEATLPPRTSEGYHSQEDIQVSSRSLQRDPSQVPSVPPLKLPQVGGAKLTRRLSVVQGDPLSIQGPESDVEPLVAAKRRQEAVKETKKLGVATKNHEQFQQRLLKEEARLKRVTQERVQAEAAAKDPLGKFETQKHVLDALEQELALKRQRLNEQRDYIHKCSVQREAARLKGLTVPSPQVSAELDPPPAPETPRPRRSTMETRLGAFNTPTTLSRQSTPSVQSLRPSDRRRWTTMSAVSSLFKPYSGYDTVSDFQRAVERYNKVIQLDPPSEQFETDAVQSLEEFLPVPYNLLVHPPPEANAAISTLGWTSQDIAKCFLRSRHYVVPSAADDFTRFINERRDINAFKNTANPFLYGAITTANVTLKELLTSLSVQVPNATDEQGRVVVEWKLRAYDRSAVSSINLRRTWHYVCERIVRSMPKISREAQTTGLTVIINCLKKNVTSSTWDPRVLTIITDSVFPLKVTGVIVLQPTYKAMLTTFFAGEDAPLTLTCQVAQEGELAIPFKLYEKLVKLVPQAALVSDVLR